MLQPLGHSLRIRLSPPADEGAGRDSLPLEGSGEIRIARDGTWHHEGRPILRKDLVKLFSTVLERDDGGGYWLKTPVEKVRVHVEDAPFVVHEVERGERGGRQVLAFRTNLDVWVDAGRDHPIRVEQMPDTGEPKPYILVKAGLEALIARSVFYQLVELAEPGEHAGEKVLGVWSRGTYFPLGPV